MKSMSWFLQAIEVFLHLDKYLSIVITQYGSLTYGLLFVIIFCETGLVVTPFLPGDSLIFAAGTFAASGALKILPLFLLLAVAAIVGDTVNYWIGRTIGSRLLAQEHSKFIQKKHVERTQKFFEKYGAKAIVLARFVPIVRTFAPFIAGVGQMSYKKFFSFNVIGGLLWISLFTFGGYFFGNIPIVKQNFGLVVIMIIILSLVPMIVEVVRAWKEGKGDDKKEKA